MSLMDMPITWLASKPGRRTLILGSLKNGEDTRPGWAKEHGNLFPGLSQDSIEYGPFCPGDEIGVLLTYESHQFDLLLAFGLSEMHVIDEQLLAECSRVLRSSGRLLIVDTIVPGSHLRGKKARRLREAGSYINSWHRLRNPRHQELLTECTWEWLLITNGWAIERTLTRQRSVDFHHWLQFYNPTPENQIRLEAMLFQAPENAFDFLTPIRTGDRIAFRLSDIFILACLDDKEMK